MAVPANPTISSIVTEALKRAGRTSPSATQISDATEHQFREVKSDIMMVAPDHPYLQIVATASTIAGEQRYALPADANKMVSLVLLNGPDDHRGTAQAATGTSITLDSDFPGGDDQLIGYYVLITGGTGAGQYRQITDYVSATKVATIDIAWTVTPTGSSTFLVVNETRQLWSYDMASEFDQLLNHVGLGRPYIASVYSDEFNLYPVPDRIYGLLFRYYADLDQLDDTSAVFLNLLREWRSLWVQGVAVKVMQRFDEDRYQLELQVYQTMLAAFSNQCCGVTAIQYRDI
jgi:hypothetical protein